MAVEVVANVVVVDDDVVVVDDDVVVVDDEVASGFCWVHLIERAPEYISAPFALVDACSPNLNADVISDAESIIWKASIIILASLFISLVRVLTVFLMLTN